MNQAVRTTVSADVDSAGLKRFEWSRPASGDPPAFAIRRRLSRVWLVVCEWRRRARSRALLRSLDRRAVADFCPSRCDAEHEANKPFWRA